jgi:hypothetical protein
MNRNTRIRRDNIPAQNTRLPLIGRVRVGEKRQNDKGKEYPVSLDYFIATGAYAEKFYEVFDKPNKIQIVFVSDDDFQSCIEEWDGRDDAGRRAGYGDGVNYYLWNYGGANGQYIETQNRDDVAEFSKKYKIRWRQILTINFVIPAIRGVFGVWQLQTAGDKSSINAIRNTYDEIKELAGTIVNIPFDLCVKKAVSNKPEMKTSYPVITLVPNLSAENMETLRKFFESGLDMKRAGILTDKKLIELSEHDEHPSAVIDAIAGANTVTESDVISVMRDALQKCKTAAELVEIYRFNRPIIETTELLTDFAECGEKFSPEFNRLMDELHAEINTEIENKNGHEHKN